MKVQLMLTCLCDAFFGDVGQATVEVLEKAGCEVVFPENQTCCGQPPFNSGDWENARSVCKRLLQVFDENLPIVTPSSSCAAMLRHGFGELGLPTPDAYELCEFLTLKLHYKPKGKVKATRAAFHRACHGRILKLGHIQEEVLSEIRGLELIKFDEEEQCCGFGGAFSVTHPTISSQIGRNKLTAIKACGVDTIISGDMSCLMHLRGLDNGVQIRHVAQVLAEAIR